MDLNNMSHEQILELKMELSIKNFELLDDIEYIDKRLSSYRPMYSYEKKDLEKARIESENRLVGLRILIKQIDEYLKLNSNCNHIKN